MFRHVESYYHQLSDLAGPHWMIVVALVVVVGVFLLNGRSY